MSILILIVVIAITILLGRHAIIEGMNLEKNKLTKNLNRVALHAYSIEINHPLNNKKIKFTAPVPQDLENSIKEIEFEEN